MPSNNDSHSRYPYLKDLADEIGKITGCQIRSKLRNDLCASSRQIYCYIAQSTSVFTLTEIGKEIQRDRSTVHTAIKTAKTRLVYDKKFKNLFGKVRLGLSENSRLVPYQTTMEGIVKINTHTCEAIATLSVEAWILGERMSGETEPEIHSYLEKMKQKRVLEIGSYTYLYMPETYVKRSNTQP